MPTYTNYGSWVISIIAGRVEVIADTNHCEVDEKRLCELRPATEFNRVGSVEITFILPDTLNAPHFGCDALETMMIKLRGFLHRYAVSELGRPPFSLQMNFPLVHSLPVPRAMSLLSPQKP